MEKQMKIRSKGTSLRLSVTKGHFATGHSHLNYYIDVTNYKFNLKDAKALAEELFSYYKTGTIVDTILCLDGTEVIGTCLAEALTQQVHGFNEGKNIAVLTPEHTTGSQLIFRDDTSPMIRTKNVLILAVSVATGYTVASAVEAVHYYNGNVVGVGSIFATNENCSGFPVHSVFNPQDLPDYKSVAAYECPMCKQGQKLDGLINIHGFSKL